MKNISKAILIIILLLIAFSVYQKKIPIAFDRYYYTSTASLNVRVGAGTEHAVFFTLQKGDNVEVLSKKKNWFKIRHQEKTGYAYSKYLKYSRTDHAKIIPLFQQSLTYMYTGIFTVIILLIGFSVFRKKRDNKGLKTVTSIDRGTSSERELVSKLLKYGMPAQMIFHDLYLKKNGSHFSQIDLAAVTDVGIIVFEVKDYSGWIYGNGDQRQWTQVLAQGRQKYLFQNPIRQNHGHMAVLRRKINCFENIPFYSIVVFYGECVLKNVKFIPDGTFITKSERVFEVLDLILKKNDPFQYSNRGEVMRVLKEAEKNGECQENQIQHIENVKDMLGTDRIFD